MTVVPKEILRVGHYHTNRGTLLITKDRLKHFEKDGNEMIADNLSVPLPLNHQPEAYPVNQQDLANRVKNNTGFAKRYYLLGDSLWCDLDVTDKEIEPKLNSTIKFVSPQISPKFVDGRGRKWLDVITHIALTPRPRFIDQQPFGAVPNTVGANVLLSIDDSGCDLCLSMEDLVEENQLEDLLSDDSEGHEGIHEIYSRYAKAHDKNPDAWVHDNAAANTSGAFSVDTAPNPPEGIPFERHEHFHHDMAKHHLEMVKKHAKVAENPKSTSNEKALAEMDMQGHSQALNHHLQRKFSAQRALKEAVKNKGKEPVISTTDQDSGLGMHPLDRRDAMSGEAMRRRIHFTEHGGAGPSLMSDDNEDNESVETLEHSKGDHSPSKNHQHAANFHREMKDYHKEIRKSLIDDMLGDYGKKAKPNEVAEMVVHINRHKATMEHHANEANRHDELAIKHEEKDSDKPLDMTKERTEEYGPEYHAMSDDSPFIFGFVNKNGDLPIALSQDEGIYGAPVDMSKDPESCSKAGEKMKADLPKESWSSIPSDNDHTSIERQAILGPRLWAGKKESGKVIHRTAPMHKDDQPLFKKIAAVPPMLETVKTVFVHPHADILHPADLAAFHEAMANHHAAKKGTYVFKKAGVDGAPQDGVYPHTDREHQLAELWHGHMAGIHRHNAALMKYFGGSKESFGWKHARKARYGDHLSGLNQEPEMIHSFVD